MADPAPGAAPDEASLHEAALRHLARYACSAAGLARVLERRVDRWARAAAAEPEARAAGRAVARAVVARLQAAGAVDDTRFAEGRARSLARAGRSRRAIAAHLAARGVDAATARAAAGEDAEAELAAALLLARRRRLGPFATGAADPAQARRALAALARGGFAEAVAREALAMEPAAAAALLLRRRQTG